MTYEDHAENIRDKSPRVTDAEALALALSNVGTMSPRLRKLYDDAAALLREQAAAQRAAAAPTSDDTALLFRALNALKYHQEQTRPIETTSRVISALHARLAASDEPQSAVAAAFGGIVQTPQS